MSEKRFIVETVEITDCKTGKSRIAKVITDTHELCSCEDLYELCDDLNKLAEENEQLKQKIQRWKNLYELKDAEVTARVDGLNKVCEYYTSEVLFKSDVDPNKAVKEVINRILNTEVEK